MLSHNTLDPLITYHPSPLFKTQVLASFCSSLASRFVLITDENLSHLYGKELLEYSKQYQLSIHPIVIPPGEKSKTREMKEYIENQLFSLNYGSDSCLISFGGGVISDLSGFIAATFCRGIPFISIPTTLLAMVDASLGGKNGVNTPYGKNLVGTIYLPKKIFIVPDFLLTLPKKEIENGLIETLKHALIKDKDFFKVIEQQLPSLLNKEEKQLYPLIQKSMDIKLSIIRESRSNSNKRHLLNFGHTIGHAVEQYRSYQISHGEAIAIGLLGELIFSHHYFSFPLEHIQQVYQIIIQCFPDLQLPNLEEWNKLLPIMNRDKKAINNTPRFNILKNIGSAHSFDGLYVTRLPLLFYPFNAMEGQNSCDKMHRGLGFFKA